MTATTIVEILGKDNTRQAFDSVSRGLGNIESAAMSARNTLVGLAAGLVSIQSVRAIADAALDVQKFNNALVVGLGSVQEANSAMSFLRKTSEELGLDLKTSSEQFSKLAAAAKGTALEGQGTRDIFLGIAKAATALGLSSDEAGGALLAIQQIVSKGKVSLEELSGQLGERLPGALQIAARSLGLTTQELNKLVSSGNLTAEQLLPALAAELEKTFGAQSQEAAKGLQSQINRFNTALFDLKVAIGETGLIDFLSQGIQLATRFANSMAGLFGKGEQLSAIEKQKNAIAGLKEELSSLNDKKNIPVVGNLLFDKKQADLLEQRISDAVADLSRMESATTKVEDASKALVPITTQVSVGVSSIGKAAKQTVSESQKFLDALIKEASQSGKNKFELQRLEAAKLGVLKSAAPLIDALEREENALREAGESAGRYRAQLDMAAGITESVMTDSERFAQTQVELNALYQQGYISLETYNRALKQAKGEFKEIGVVSTSVFDDISQFSIQAARNIQTALSDALIEGIKGFDNFADAALNIIKRLAAEIASVKILQGLGLGGALGLGSSSAIAGSGGIGGALNLASLGSGTMNLFGTGFGATGAISGLGSMLPGAAGSFFTGMGISGGGAAASAAGFSGAASMGASFAAAAGPLIALAAVDQIGRMLAGDKSTGSFVDNIPVIGGFAGALFGHGPMKFREQQLRGMVSSTGFEGEAVDVFRAKGGLLVGNKHQRQGTENEDQILELFDTAIVGFYDSVKDFADKLGLDADAVDSYTEKIFIRSKKGERFTEEAIAGILSNISDGFARGVIPEIDKLSKSGESAYQTMIRLNNEFDALVNAGTILGKTLAESTEFIMGSSFEGRSAFIDAAGGMDAFLSKVQLFANEFLTEEQRIAPIIETTLDHLNDLGLGFIRTRDQFTELVQSFGKDGGISENQLQGLLGLAGAADQIFDYLDSIKQAEDIKPPVEEKIIDNSAAILSERNGLERQYYQLIGDTASIRRMELDALDPSNRALLERIYLIEDERKAQEDAARERAQLESDIKSAFGILQNAVNSEISSITDKFKDLISEVDASIRETSSSISKLASISDALKSTVDQIRGMNAGEARLQIQKAINSATQGNIVDLDSIRGALSSLGSLDTSGFSSREDFARQTSQDASLIEKLGSAVEDQLTVEERTLETLEDQKTQLQGQFEEEHKTLTGILNKAQEQIDSIIGVDKSLNALLGKKSPFVSSIQSIALSISQIVSNLQDTQGFASGGYHPGGLRIVGENGPELEATGPSRIISNSDLANMIGGGGGSTVNINLAGLEKSIDRLNGLVEQVITYTKQTSDTLMRVSDDGLSLRTTAA